MTRRNAHFSRIMFALFLALRAGAHGGVRVCCVCGCAAAAPAPAAARAQWIRANVNTRRLERWIRAPEPDYTAVRDSSSDPFNHLYLPRLNF